MLSSCGACNGFIPPRLTACPHCAPETVTAVAALAKVWARAVEAIVVAEVGQGSANALSQNSSGILRTKLGLPFLTARLQWW